MSVKTITVRVRIVVYALHHQAGEYGYYADDSGEVGPQDNAVWLVAEVPVSPTPIVAKVEPVQ